MLQISPKRLVCTLLGVVVCSLGACQTPKRQVAVRELAPGLNPAAREEALRAGVHEYLLDFLGEVEMASDRIAAESVDPAVRRNALLWRLNVIPAMRQACFRPNPFGAALDAWILTAQMKAFFETGPGSNAFGAHQEDTIAVATLLETQIAALWASICLTPEDAESWRNKKVDPWVEANPIETMSFARPSPHAEYAELAPDRGGAVQRFKSIDEQIAVLSTQARIYLESVFKQVRGEAQLAVDEIMPPEQIKQLIESVASASESAQRAAAVAEQMPELVHQERESIMGEVDRQRTLVMDQVSVELEQALAIIPTEREATLAWLDDELDDVLEHISRERRTVLETFLQERELVLEEVRDDLEMFLGEVSEEREAVLSAVSDIAASTMESSDAELRQAIDHFFIRLVLLVVIVILIAPLIAHLYARVWPRRWVQSS